MPSAARAGFLAALECPFLTSHSNGGFHGRPPLVQGLSWAVHHPAPVLGAQSFTMDALMFAICILHSCPPWKLHNSQSRRTRCNDL